MGVSPKIGRLPIYGEELTGMIIHQLFFSSLGIIIPPAFMPRGI